MRLPILLVFVTALCILVASPTAAQLSEPTAGVDARQLVEVTAIDYAFRAPDVVRPGWTTIRFSNEGEESHFVYISRLPEGKTSDDYEMDLSMPFSDIWSDLREGKIAEEEAPAMLGEKLPEWFPSLGIVGGPALLEPGRTSEVTLNLQPGTHMLECYVKTEDGEIHFMEGMMRPLIVTGEPVDAAPPVADVRVKLSNFTMDVDGDLEPGKRTVEVLVEENPESGFGHNVHVARLDADTDVDEIVRWMNWFDVNGMRNPAPATFLGGTHPMPAGSKAYFTVDLKPGRYLFLSEFTGHQGVLQEVEVKP